MNRRDEELQALCRSYLKKLRRVAKKRGLAPFVDEIINRNIRKECNGTQSEVEMLARLCNDDRITREEVPDVVGKSYRDCCEDDLFNRIKRYKNVGTYSKVSAICIKNKKS